MKEADLVIGDVVVITADCRVDGCKEVENMTAEYQGEKDVEAFGMTAPTPIFLLQNGDVIHGYECFWERQEMGL